jgi:hypothetical protein
MGLNCRGTKGEKSSENFFLNLSLLCMLWETRKGDISIRIQIILPFCLLIMGLSIQQTYFIGIGTSQTSIKLPLKIPYRLSVLYHYDFFRLKIVRNDDS